MTKRNVSFFCWLCGLTLLGAMLLPANAFGQKQTRKIENVPFVYKGEWHVGGDFSYTTHSNENYKFLILKDWSGNGVTFSVSPYFDYVFKDNVSAGFRFNYSRQKLIIDNINVKIDEDLNFQFKDSYDINQMFYSSGYIRTYLSLGTTSRFGLFNEARLTFGAGNGKIVNGKYPEEISGTYQNVYELKVGVAPGIVAFINEYAAVEASVDLMGFSCKWINQTTNQVYKGSRKTTSANFKINLLSINLGVAFYL